MKFDILNLDDDIEWSHIQLLKYLNENGIECVFADMWTDDNIAWLVGCNTNNRRLAKVLGVHEECIYNHMDQCFVIINLFQEKYLRGLLD